MGLWHEVTGEGSPVLLIHEGICDGRMWDRQMRTFSSKHRVVRCDLRGFGQTSIPPQPYSHASDVVELLEGLRLGPTALVAVSLGGRVALEVAVARPDLVDRLVLVGAGLPDHTWSDTVERFGEEEEAALGRDDLDAAIEANLRMWVDGPNRTANDVDPEMRRFVGRMQRRAFVLQEPVWEEAQENLLVPDVGSRFTELRVPVLVLVGGEDVSDMHEIADRLAGGIPGARKVVIAGTAHVPSLEVPEEFDRLVLEFLRDGAAAETD